MARMREDTRDNLIALARQDLDLGEFQRAKQRLRAVLHDTPYHRPALELLGDIYYRQRDFRNAIAYWSRCGCWDGRAAQAANRIFRGVTRALVHENPKAARHWLVAFAGSMPPGDLGRRLSGLQAAYYQLDRKRAKLRGLACVPFSGGCLLGVLGVLAMILGVGWSWFVMMGGLAVTATVVTLLACAYSYFRISRAYQETIDIFQSTTSHQPLTTNH